MGKMNDLSGREDVMVLAEQEAVELIALLMSSAGGLVHEPADYGPMRLVTATQKLVSTILPRATAETRPFLDLLDEGIKTCLPRRRAEPERWYRFLDEANRWVARELMRQAGLSREK